MTQRAIRRRKAHIMVLCAEGPARGGGHFTAVTLPGLFRGFGSTKQEACSMAVDLANLDWHEFQSVRGAGIKGWWDAIWERSKSQLPDVLPVIIEGLVVGNGAAITRVDHKLRGPENISVTCVEIPGLADDLG